MDLGVRGVAQAVEDRGRQVFGPDAPLARVAADLVRRAVDLAAADAAAGQGDREDRAPVVAAAVPFERGVRPNSAMQTTSVSSSSPRWRRSSSRAEKARSVGGTQHVLEPLGFVDVAVPAGVVRGLVGAAIPVDLHQRDARLDQPAGQQDALAERAAAVAVAR